MPRRPAQKPWLHSPSGYWSITLDGRRHYLDKDYRVACRKLRELKAERQRQASGAKEWLNESFAVLADEFLTDIQSRRAPATYEGYRYRLQRALQVLGTELRVCEMRKHHLAKIEQAMTGQYSCTSIRDSLATVQGVFTWAIRLDLLDFNPLAGYIKPRARGRNRIIEPDEFQRLLRHSGANIRRVLLALRMTGARPGELRKLRWSNVDIANCMWVLKEHKTSTLTKDGRPRLILLPDPIVKMCQWLARSPHTIDDFVFLNASGHGFTKDALSRAFARVRKRAGIEIRHGERLVCYSNRHSFATQHVGKVSDYELSQLMGHTTGEMLRRYIHLDRRRLSDIQRRLQQKPSDAESA